MGRKGSRLIFLHQRENINLQILERKCNTIRTKVTFLGDENPNKTRLIVVETLQWLGVDRNYTPFLLSFFLSFFSSVLRDGEKKKRGLFIFSYLVFVLRNGARDREGGRLLSCFCSSEWNEMGGGRVKVANLEEALFPVGR